MIKIDKSQRDYLIAHGAKYHDDIHTTHSHHKQYYLTASPKMKELLGNCLYESGIRDIAKACP